MATITPIDTTTDTPASAATKTNDNFTSLESDVDTNTAKTGITAQQASDITTNNAKVSADGSINTHSDVDASSPANGQALVFNSSTEKWEATSIDTFKQSQMFPVLRNSGNLTNNPYSIERRDYSLSPMSSTQEVLINFFVPSHAVSIDSVKLVLLPDTTETIQSDFEVNFAANGEGELTHDATSDNDTLAVTSDQLTEWDLTSLSTNIFADLEPGDYGGLRVKSDTSNIQVFGLVITWNV